MIKINEIIEEPADLYFEDTKIGEVKNSLQFNDVRVQIMRESAEGYYVRFRGVRYDINKYGRMDLWPKGLFDLWDVQLDELISITPPPYRGKNEVQ